MAITPGLAFPRYLLHLAHALSHAGSRVLLVDLLAWRGPRPRVQPSMEAMGVACAQALTIAGVAPAPQAQGPAPLTVFGHSTGAQVGLEAVLALAQGKGLSLVMAGPTFQPAHRSWPAMARAALTAYRQDSPRELAVLRDLAKARLDVVRLTDSARRHRPEERLAGLSVPLTLTAGVNDGFASLAWLETLAAASRGDARIAVLPGSHNNPFTHPADVAAVVLA